MAAMGAAPDMTLYITPAEAQLEIGRLVAEQIEAFNAQRQVIVEPSQEACLLITSWLQMPTQL